MARRFGRLSRVAITCVTVTVPAGSLAAQSGSSPPPAPIVGPAPLRLGVALGGVVKAIDVMQNARVAAGQALLEIDCLRPSSHLRFRTERAS